MILIHLYRLTVGFGNRVALLSSELFNSEEVTRENLVETGLDLLERNNLLFAFKTGNT